jgi:hypothetical protein
MDPPVRSENYDAIGIAPPMWASDRCPGVTPDGEV